MTNKLQAELERLRKENAALIAQRSGKPAPKAPVAFTLYPHQVEGIHWLKTRINACQSSILADDQGLGKTAMSLLSAPETAPILTICPKIAKGVWRRETAKFTPYRTVKVIEKRADFTWPKPGEVVVINFDSLPKVALAQKKDAAGKPMFHPAKKDENTVMVANHPLDERLAEALAFKEAMMEAIVERVKDFQTPSTPILPPLPRPATVNVVKSAGPPVKPSPKPVALPPLPPKPIPPLPAGVDKTSREGIAHYLKHSDAMVERSVVVLYERQTADEQRSGATKHLNNQGFNGVDGSFGTALAKQVLAGRHLSPKQLAIARKILAKYCGQLSEAAERVAESKGK